MTIMHAGNCSTLVRTLVQKKKKKPLLPTFDEISLSVYRVLFDPRQRYLECLLSFGAIMGTTVHPIPSSPARPRGVY
jgi:hypothetical protein